MRNEYLSPEIKVIFNSAQDIMNGSDTDINVGDLFSEDEA